MTYRMLHDHNKLMQALRALLLLPGMTCAHKKPSCLQRYATYTSQRLLHGNLHYCKTALKASESAQPGTILVNLCYMTAQSCQVLLW